MVPLFIALSTLFSPQARASETACARAVSDILADVVDEKGLIRTQTLDVKVSKPRGATLRELKDEKRPPVQYLVDMNDNLWFVDDAAQQFYPGSFSRNEVQLARLDDGSGKTILVPIKESGMLSYLHSDMPMYKKLLFGNRDKRGFLFEKQAGFDLSDEESAAIFRQLDETGESSEGALRVASKDSGYHKTRVYKCTDVFDAHTRGDKFIFDKLGVDMSLLTASIVVMSPERFDGPLAYWGMIERDPDKDYEEDLLAADYVSTPMHTLIKGSASLALIRANAGISKSMSTRFGVSVVSTGLQTLMYAALTDDDSKGIGLYNAGYMVFSIAKSHYLDKWIFNSLPNLAYASCLKNSALRFVVSPTVVRIGEGLGSTLIYLGGRKAIVGQ